jgi:RNA polymerase sigma factor (sigma-70 family)
VAGGKNARRTQSRLISCSVFRTAAIMDKTMMDDAVLLRRYAEERSEDAFAELVRRYVNQVYFAALRQVGGDAHRAEDVTQAVFTLLARKAAALAGRATLAGWLFVATRNVAREVRRAERRRQLREQEAQIMQELTTESAPPADWERLRPVIDDAMNELNERDREAVLLRFFHERSFAEIGAALRLKEDAARMRTERALDKLRAELARRGITSTGAALALALTNQAALAAPAGLATTVTGAALTGAAASAGTTTALSLLSFMSTTKVLLSVAAVVGFLAIGVATREVIANRAASAALATATGDHDALRAKLQSVAQRAEAAEQDAVRLKKATSEARAALAAAEARAAAEAQAAKEAAEWNPAAEGKAFLARHPEVRQALLDWAKAGVNFEYGAFFKAAGLTPAQIETFQALMLARDENGYLFATSNGPKGKVLQFPASTDVPFGEVESRLRALLGEGGYAKLEEYRHILEGRQYTTQMAGALCFTETPLSAEQAGRLVESISTVHWQTKAPNPFETYWDTVMSKAQSVLSPPQWAVLEGIRTQERIREAMRVAMTPPATTDAPGK